MHTSHFTGSAIIKCVFGEGLFGVFILDVPGLVAWRSHGAMVKVFAIKKGMLS